MLTPQKILDLHSKLQELSLSTLEKVLNRFTGTVIADPKAKKAVQPSDLPATPSNSDQRDIYLKQQTFLYSHGGMGSIGGEVPEREVRVGHV